MTDTAKTKEDFEKIIKDAQEGIKRLTEKPKITNIYSGQFYEINGYPTILCFTGTSYGLVLLAEFCTGIPYTGAFGSREQVVKMMNDPAYRCRELTKEEVARRIAK